MCISSGLTDTTRHVFTGSCSALASAPVATARPWWQSRLSRSRRARLFRKGAVYGPGRRLPRDRSFCRRWRMVVKVAGRNRWFSRRHVRVLVVLLEALGPDGRCDPSHATIARRAGCSLRTVGRALRRARFLGFLTWVQRMSRHGDAAFQVSNQYQLVLPSDVEVFSQVVRRRPKGSAKVTEEQSESISNCEQREVLFDPTDPANADVQLTVVEAAAIAAFVLLCEVPTRPP